MAWKIQFQLLCSDIPNLNDCNKFTTKGYGYISILGNTNKASRCRYSNVKGLHTYNS